MRKSLLLATQHIENETCCCRQYIIVAMADADTGGDVGGDAGWDAGPLERLAPKLRSRARVVGVVVGAGRRAGRRDWSVLGGALKGQQQQGWELLLRLADMHSLNSSVSRATLLVYPYSK